MLPIALALVFACLLGATPARAQEPFSSKFGRVLTKTFSYLPSRVVDALDPFRVRLRIGPGTAVSARATEKADYFRGSYSGVFAGLPGPRGSYRGRLRPPLGLEARSRDVSAARSNLTAGLSDPGPTYSATEFTAGFQLYFFGLDIGLDPAELTDWVVGFAAKDPRGDDISLKTGY